ncbi:hypothetical protein LCGC14_1090640 [marine sediment metagenome]|uniref:Uncharacterized protein n=1 Tax=marine sediment metagenome TaxID=412755 RepID=A0A0F9MGY3_9ZZZZ
MDENTEEAYIPRCPHCGDEILELNAFVLEENKYTVEAVELVKDMPKLDWSTSEVIESSSEKTDYECPSCEETIFTERNGDSQPPIVIDFLRGVGMTWVQDVTKRAMVLETFNKRGTHQGFPKPEGAYYAEAFPRAGGDVGIYFVDPTASVKGMTPYETN